MPSRAEEIIAKYRRNPVLQLTSKLSDADLAALTTAAVDAFSAVEELRVENSRDADWDAGRFMAFALQLPKLSRLNLTWSLELTDAGVQAIAAKLTALNALYLGGCKLLTDVGVRSIAAKLTALNTLNLGYCDKLTDVGVRSIAAKLTALNTLDLWGCNRVTELPDALRKLSRLRELDVREIPALKLPQELTSNPQNPQAILDYYFRQAREGKRTLNEAKLILVGNEAVGKTSLVNYLVQGKSCEDTPKTPGVAIVEGVDVTAWNVDKSAAGDTPLRLNVWDFGGQQILCETHRFFLTARSLYLVVLSARKENENEQEANLREWFRAISARTVEDVPVIVVINKTEPPQELQLDEDRLKREFPIIKKFIRTSCRTGLGINELRKAIVEVIRAELPHVRDQFPVSYFNIKEELTKTARRSSILNTDTYRDKCKTESVTERREQENLLELLDRIGVVVKYDEATLLDPNWLTTAVYRVLMHSDVVGAEGEFSVSGLGKLLAGLPPKDYPEKRWPFIATMMERFGLSFSLPNTKDRYLVPNRFSVKEPNLPGWDAPGLLRFRYEYQHTPARWLLPRFVVLAHRHLTRPRIAWLNGVVLGIQGCEVLVKMEPHDRRLSITVRGPEDHRRSALAVAREHFATVHDLNNLVLGRDVFAKIPVGIPGQPDAAFDYDDLETRERDGVTQVSYPKTDIRFAVKELLAGVGPEPVIRSRDDDRNPNRRGGIGGDHFHFHGVGAVYKGEIHQPEQENNMSNISVNNSGNMTGVAIGDHAQVTAEKIISNVRQQLPENASIADELKAVLAAALEELAKQKLDDEDREEAKETVEKIEKEMAKPEPSKDRVSRWVDGVEKVSTVVGKLIRSAGAIVALFS